MRLYELIKMDNADFDIPELTDLDENNTAFSGTFDRHEIYGTTWFKDYHGFFIKNDEKIIAMLLITFEPVLRFDKSTYEIKRIWVDDEYRNNGLATSLVAYVTKKLETPLWFDSEVTDMGLSFLKGLVKSGIFKKTYYSNDIISNVTPENLYELDNEWYILLEDSRHVATYPLDGVNIKIKEAKYFTGGDYL